jgi:hypothetical protein
MGDHSIEAGDPAVQVCGRQGYIAGSLGRLVPFDATE